VTICGTKNRAVKASQLLQLQLLEEVLSPFEPWVSNIPIPLLYCVPFEQKPYSQHALPPHP
jgi:hypothetical protein